MALLWDHIYHALIVILLCIDLTWKPWVIATRKVLCWKKFRKRFGKEVYFCSMEPLYKNFMSFYNLWIALIAFLDLRLHINEHNKICVNVYAKPTNSLSYVLPSTCYPKKNISKVPKGIALRLRRICNSARDYNLTLVRKTVSLC